MSMLRTPTTMLLAITMMSCTLELSQSLQFAVVNPCYNPLGNEKGDTASGTNSQGVAIYATTQEFYSSFASIFSLSDGSRISIPAGDRVESLRYMQELLYAIGIYVNETASKDAGMDVLQICGDDVLKMVLLASVGNFVASPSDPNISPQSSMKSMPSVVVDAYTGQFIMHTPYDAVRGYFVEALLVISIIVISRLTFVRNNTYNTVVHLDQPQAPSSTAGKIA